MELGGFDRQPSAVYLMGVIGGLEDRADWSLPEQLRELTSADARSSQDARERASLDRLISMDGHRDGIGNVWMAEDVMAAADALHVPALLFKGGDDLLAADRRKLVAHAWTATRPRWTAGIGRPSSCMTSR